MTIIQILALIDILLLLVGFGFCTYSALQTYPKGDKSLDIGISLFAIVSILSLIIALI